MKENCWDMNISEPKTGAENMALDEAAFQLAVDGKLERPLLRFYTWSEPCITIGYFQRYADFTASGLPVIRRLTGGLAVNHSTDLSYSLVISETDLPCIRDQQRTYMIIHSALRAGLENAGIKTDYCAQNGDTRANLCTASVFAHDLAIDGKKILGSCQRRRGNVLLQQGSIHIQPHEGASLSVFTNSIATGFAKTLGITITENQLFENLFMQAENLSVRRYQNSSWNAKY